MYEEHRKQIGGQQPAMGVDVAKRARSQDSCGSLAQAEPAKKLKLEADAKNQKGTEDLKEVQSDEGSVDSGGKEEGKLENGQKEEKEGPERFREEDEDEEVLQAKQEGVNDDSKASFGTSHVFGSGGRLKVKPFGSSMAFGSVFGESKRSAEGKKLPEADNNRSDDNSGKSESASSSGTSNSSGSSSGGGGADGEGDMKEADGAKPFSFGSGLAFGSGFKVLKTDNKSSGTIFSKTARENSDTNELSSKQATAEVETGEPVEDADGIVRLTKQVIESGEEAEDSVYQANAKLYQLCNMREGWKERGVGAIHVNKNRITAKARIVMRSRGLLKVILNLPLLKGFTVQKGFPGSLQSEKFIRILTIGEANEPVQYALKTAKGEIAEELFKMIEDLIPED
ncbi:Yrb2p Ecym_4321 [Eremothecium cymbalariae DBVPG|uniref:RanBD1 domain-containing protein n=1 Tax=Eremothecium cymbalariae (strain CBS 270.75 / DBVPG 7215 / KCTC 17166 / NRRL Y-17582) TaxID=931890 RepID=G8JTN1_ERECY|nr:hypothetical protein Ecym_4321 [Eremothecium cymbalariae DBVPG\